MKLKNTIKLVNNRKTIRQLEVSGWRKMTEEDSHKEGCDPETIQVYSGREIFTANTAQEMVKCLMRFTGTDNIEWVTINAGDEAGRIDIQLMENAHDMPAVKEEIKVWKQGKVKLWLATYSFYVEDVTRKPAKLIEG